MKRDQELKNKRLVFYEKDVAKLDSELDAFLELSKARCALLVDRDGHLVTRRGEPMKTSEEAVSALVAGSFAATMEMAKLLGESEFSILFHQGKRDSIQLQLIGDRTLLVVLFDTRTNLGMVRFYAKEAGDRIHKVLATIPDDQRESGLTDEYGQGAQDALDKLF